jgi:hypothetical protein
MASVAGIAPLRKHRWPGTAERSGRWRLVASKTERTPMPSFDADDLRFPLCSLASFRFLAPGRRP